jgi:hypothetical protein
LCRSPRSFDVAKLHFAGDHKDVEQAEAWIGLYCRGRMAQRLCDAVRARELALIPNNLARGISEEAPRRFAETTDSCYWQKT